MISSAKLRESLLHPVLEVRLSSGLLETNATQEQRHVIFIIFRKCISQKPVAPCASSSSSAPFSSSSSPRDKFLPTQCQRRRFDFKPLLIFPSHVTLLSSPTFRVFVSNFSPPCHEWPQSLKNALLAFFFLGAFFALVFLAFGLVAFAFLALAFLAAVFCVRATTPFVIVFATSGCATLHWCALVSIESKHELKPHSSILNQTFSDPRTRSWNQLFFLGRFTFFFSFVLLFLMGLKTTDYAIQIFNISITASPKKSKSRNCQGSRQLNLYRPKKRSYVGMLINEY